MTRPDLSVVVVSRDVRDLLAACLESLHQSDNGFVIETLVVDAASSDGSSAMVRKRFPAVRQLASRENLGFTRGNNWAIRLARGRHVMLLNPDTVVRPGALRALVTFLDAHPDVGVAAPKLVFPDGSVQSSRRRFPRPVTGFVESTVLERWLGRSRVVREYRLDDGPADAPQDVDWVVGAAMVVRREAFEQAGLLDERFFMYSEEVDLCRRVRAAGWRVVYVPDAVVVHHEGRSSEQNLVQRNLDFHESRFRYYRKHFGRAWSLALRLAVLGHFLFVGAEEAAKLAAGRNPELRRARLEMTGRILARQGRDLVAALAT
ncbi:MAG TPA: glycosyltransferase family 2 protein [Chloroflexota bacterium]|nr:glycosyltransferase family 2 protein [Chloroflexota bacterium]